MKERKYIKSGYTTNFDKFVIPEWQREINEGTIGKICKSIQRHGFIGAILVTNSDKNKWMRGNLNNWNHAFAVVDFFNNGDFKVEVVEIINGRTTLWGEYIDGSEK